MEEQIKRIKYIELPTLELEEHRTALRQALLKKVIESNRRKVNLWEKAIGYISDLAYGISQGVILHKPIAKLTLISGFAGAMLVLVLLTVIKPSFLVGPSDIVQAEEIARNSSQIRSALGGSDISAIAVTSITDNKVSVVVTGTSGKTVSTVVDIKQKTVVGAVVTITMSVGSQYPAQITTRIINQWSDLITVDRKVNIGSVAKAKATDIVKTDSISAMLFTQESEITGIYQAHLYASELTLEDGQTITFPITIGVTGGTYGGSLVVVEVTNTAGVQSILVDLDAGKVITVIPGIVTVETPAGKP